MAVVSCLSCSALRSDTPGSPLRGAAVDVDQRTGNAAADVAGQQTGHGRDLLDGIQPLDGGLLRVAVHELLIGDARPGGRLRSELAHGVRLYRAGADRVAGDALGAILERDGLSKAVDGVLVGDVVAHRGLV